MTDTKPVFNFENLSRKWLKRWSRIQLEMAQRALIVQTEAKPNLSSADQVKLFKGKAESAEKLFELEDERDKLLIEAIESIPPEWLVSSAPDNLSWDNVNDLDWVKSSKFDSLIELANQERQADPKN